MKSTINNLGALSKLFDGAPRIELTKKSRVVIFSDLHMGNGSSNDDFANNAALFQYALKKYYLPKEYQLLLNGDVEELQRFEESDIHKQWKKVYKLFDAFKNGQGLIKLVGNHDIALLQNESSSVSAPVEEAIRFEYKGNTIFVFHGHQASKKYNKHNALVGYTLRYVANPLGIKNYSVSHNSRKQYKIEKNAYNFASNHRIMAVIGHTHRPLFESLPKSARLRFKIEQLCREYSENAKSDNNALKKLIDIYKNELIKINQETGNSKELLLNNLYNSNVHIPCLFNSGCVIGKRGMTALELNKGQIRLVHWFDKKISKKYLKHTGYQPQQVEEGSDYFRVIINREKLSYIFTRINLLA